MKERFGKVDGKYNPLVGKRFGRLVVAEVLKVKRHHYAKCVCDCGNIKSVRTDHLINKKIRSCGCLLVDVMLGKSKIHIGERYERLAIISVSPNRTKSGKPYFICRCDCGNIKEVELSHLRSGDTRSCGCMQQESRTISNLIHGENRKGKTTRIYTIWGGMNARCRDQNNVLYGGRGIDVCKEWSQSFIAFRDWAVCNGYSDDLSIDRKDNDKGYGPENCRWSTSKEQSRNKRNSRLLIYNGEVKTVVDWSDETGMNAKLIEDRFLRGWDTKDIFERPIRKAKRKTEVLTVPSQYAK